MISLFTALNDKDHPAHDAALKKAQIIRAKKSDYVKAGSVTRDKVLDKAKTSFMNKKDARKSIADKVLGNVEKAKRLRASALPTQEIPKKAIKNSGIKNLAKNLVKKNKKVLAVGAGLGALGYGASKLYKSIKNKKQK